ncbi:MAG: hypothetical protein H0U74_10280 [Bradymonadaceae bacterium]|nr:hypothetical protein [Lujinxingiaceae bacterium]
MLTPVAASHSGVPTDERFWRFNARILARGLTCLVYAGLMYIGLALGLVAVDALLDTKLNDWYDGDADDPKSDNKMDVSISADRVELNYRGQPWHSDLTSLRHFAEKRLDQRRLPRELRSLIVVDSSGRQVAQLLLSHVSIELHGERAIYNSLRGHIIIVEP